MVFVIIVIRWCFVVGFIDMWILEGLSFVRCFGGCFWEGGEFGVLGISIW